VKAALVVLALASVAPRDAAAADCANEADRLRSHLEQADISTSRWNLAWTVAFGVAAAGQFTLALTEWNPFGEFDADYRDTLWVGGTKATIGLASRLVFPLGVTVPAANADRCVELAQLREAATGLAKKERQGFWLTHIGGTALNLAGVAVLWKRRSFGVGAISFAISWPVGLTSAYTQPRKTWHLVREEKATWSVGIAPSREQTLLVLGGEW
jgi:hypothetical protein